MPHSHSDSPRWCTGTSSPIHSAKALSPLRSASAVQKLRSIVNGKLACLAETLFLSVSIRVHPWSKSVFHFLSVAGGGTPNTLRACQRSPAFPLSRHAFLRIVARGFRQKGPQTGRRRPRPVAFNGL